MATFGEMKDSVFAVLRDSERTFVTNEQVGIWLNEAFMEVVARGPIHRAYTSGTTAATGSITLPTDCVKITHFGVKDADATGWELPVFVSDNVFLSWESVGTEGVDEPPDRLARVYEGVVETWPQAQSMSYEIEYIQRPVKMSDNGDTPDIPEEYHLNLVNYARGHAKMQEGELEEASVYFGMWLEGLPRKRSMWTIENPKTIDLVPAPSYWGS